MEPSYEIYRWVVDSVIVPPVSPALEQESRQVLQYRNYLSTACLPFPMPERGKGFHTRGAWYRQINPATSLLQVNKQVNAEVTRFLQHLRITDYSVHIMYVKGLGVFPIWSISALPKSPYINSVHAILRTSDGPAAVPGHSRDEPGLGPGWNPSPGWKCNNVFLTYLEGLLSTLFNRGPGFLDRSLIHLEEDDSIAPRYVVDHLIINIVSRTNTNASGRNNMLGRNNESQAICGRLVLLKGKGKDKDPLTPEDRLATVMIWLLEKILGPEAYLPHIGMMVIEQIISSLIFMVNGKEVYTIDIEERLQQWRTERLAKEHPKVQEYQEWRHWVDGRRERMKEGLELDNTRPPHIDLWGGLWGRRVGARF
ncbi:unnamed protein product [Clonostachys byssicola]|uniref:Uncharacterized protein n=1 Tax=Clonostachys byssicola TaxID=160290 RepID=A0A9N9Y1C8_9HYPO|nr:unnamed protein product [Clonostachys byssicola]